MTEAIQLAVIGAVFIVAPLAILGHYVTEWRKSRGLSAQDEATLEELRRTADKLDDRLASMERILDDEVPDWRSRHYDR